ncbi:MAG: sugar phosphate nucleotidyltransferase [Candidatus Hodarchaeales archaeon]|jgi:NDP-sugar pyrophosphorylase family protein
MISNMKALILSGGVGNEMEPLSRNVPKTMLYLHGKPVLRYVIDGLIDFGIRDFVVVVGHLSDKVIRYLQGIQDKRLRIKAVYQGNRKGVAGAILSAKNEFEGQEKFVLAHGDIIAPLRFYEHLFQSYQRAISQHGSIDGTVITTLKGNISDYGVVSIDEKGYINQLYQYPNKIDQNGIGNYIVAGAAILPVKFLNLLEKTVNVEQAYNELLAGNAKLQTAIWDDIWVDLGIPWDMLDASRLLFDKESYSFIHSTAKISPTAHISGIVMIERDVVIDNGAVIKGPVYIGRGSYIGTNALLRDYTSIEAYSKIGFSVEIKNSVLQPRTKVGRLAFIGDSVIGRDVQIRSGVTVQNEIGGGRSRQTIKLRGYIHEKLGCAIGDGADVGANSVIMPLSVIESGEEIGPGQVVEKRWELVDE